MIICIFFVAILAIFYLNGFIFLVSRLSRSFFAIIYFAPNSCSLLVIILNNLNTFKYICLMLLSSPSKRLKNTQNSINHRAYTESLQICCALTLYQKCVYMNLFFMLVHTHIDHVDTRDKTITLHSNVSTICHACQFRTYAFRID